MISNISDTDKQRIIALFQAKHQAEEESKLTMQGYKESFADVAESIGAKLSDLNKAYGDWKLMESNPEMRNNRDTIMSLVFNG